MCCLLFPLLSCYAGGNAESPAAGVMESPANVEPAGSANTSENISGSEEGKNMKALIVYFSWSGNTEAVAGEIQRATGADMFELIPGTPYTDDYNALLSIAQNERRSGTRPAISGGVDDLSDYDVIFLGYPNWWADMPMIVYTFLDTYDLSGKTIAPFCTSGGSGLSGTLNTIRNMEPQANVLDGLHVGGSSASNSSAAVTRWLQRNGLA